MFSDFQDIEFASPIFFWLFSLLPLAVAYYFLTKRKRAASLTMPSLKGFSASRSGTSKLKPLLFILRCMALSVLIIALARPRVRSDRVKIKSVNGIDIVMSMDVSSSMLAKDFKPNRLSAMKEIAGEFIRKRVNDRFGLVVFSGESYTKTPLTADQDMILSSLETVTYGEMEDGTAIGLGIATAVNRLKESKAKSKVIILLTDGVNNAGFIEPATASTLAMEFGIKIYTIAIGTRGVALTPVAINPDGSFRFGRQNVEIDEELMRDIAGKTGGRYFRATDNESLKQVYEEIEKLEKSEIQEIRYTSYDEKYRILTFLALGLLFLEFLLRHTLFKSFI